jgi:hypothetical protein
VSDGNAVRVVATESVLIDGLQTLVDGCSAALGGAVVTSAIQPLRARTIEARLKTLAVLLLVAVAAHAATLALLSGTVGMLGWTFRATLVAAGVAVWLRPEPIARAWRARQATWH